MSTIYSRIIYLILTYVAHSSYWKFNILINRDFEQNALDKLVMMAYEKYMVTFSLFSITFCI